MFLGVIELVAEGTASVLGWLGLERLIWWDEAKPDPRNFSHPLIRV